VKRGAPLRRVTPLRQVTPLRRTALVAVTGRRTPVTARLAGSRRVYRCSRKVALARAAGRCEICSDTAPLTTHHRVGRQQGGSSRNPAIHSPANLLVACPTCHADLAERHPDRWTFGWKVHRDHNPALVPVLLVVPDESATPEARQEPAWWLLDDKGGRTHCDGPQTNGGAA